MGRLVTDRANVRRFLRAAVTTHPARLYSSPAPPDGPQQRQEFPRPAPVRLTVQSTATDRESPNPFGDAAVNFFHRRIHCAHFTRPRARAAWKDPLGRQTNNQHEDNAPSASPNVCRRALPTN